MSGLPPPLSRRQSSFKNVPYPNADNPLKSAGDILGYSDTVYSYALAKPITLRTKVPGPFVEALKVVKDDIEVLSNPNPPATASSMNHDLRKHGARQASDACFAMVNRLNSLDRYPVPKGGKIKLYGDRSGCPRVHYALENLFCDKKLGDEIEKNMSRCKDYIFELAKAADLENKLPRERPRSSDETTKGVGPSDKAKSTTATTNVHAYPETDQPPSDQPPSDQPPS